jgi:peptidoglycan/xylan/chitin deacetylase (PgdA/CDA1 family)
MIQTDYTEIQLIGKRITLIGMSLLVGVMALPFTASAAATNTAPAAKISFTFDDGLASAATQAAPTLSNHGLTGTDYVITNCVGMTTIPNTCRADTNRSYMTWAQIQALQNTSGWEIGSHTTNHQCLASSRAQDPDDCQATALTKAQVDSQLANSKSALAANGINATDFAPPYGDYNNTVLAEIAKYYASMRNFRNDSNNTNDWPHSDYYLWDFVVQEGTTPVASIESAIDQAIANKQWLILTFHDISPTPSSNPDEFQYGTAELDAVAAYAQAKIQAGLLKNTNVNQGLVTSDSNLLPNSTFNSGLAGGWTTDSPSNVTLDTGTNGSYPDATNAIKFVAGANNTHLFSPKVSVDPSTSYMLKNFINVAANSGGELGFFIDEYDASGNWISGQYKGGERSSFVEDMNFTYKPSSLNVSKASLQVIATGGSGITAYFDNPQWFALSSTAAPTNLMPNGTFDSGLSAGWSTDGPTNIVADSGNHGSPNNPVNSMALTATTTNKHLFSPKIPVTSGKTYTVSSYLNITALTSNEVGFYMDEYDTNGNWVNGHYITGVRATGTSTPSFNYTPSGANVASASLQVILTGSSGIHAYFDDVKWLQN